MAKRPPPLPPPWPPGWQPPSPAPKRPNWFIRHKALTAVGAIVALIGVGAALAEEEPDEPASEASNGDDARAGAAPTTSAQPEPTSQGPEPEPEPKPTREPRQSTDREEEGPGPSNPGPTATKPSTSPRPTPRPSPTFLVSRVVDGDTIELANGESVRLVGIDTPEQGDCGYEQASSHMERLVLGQRVRLTVSDEDTDRYGRLLRYVDVGKRDSGLAQIKSGLAIARYDSRDGYGFHVREPAYIRADNAAPNKACREPSPPVEPNPPPNPKPPAGPGSCAGYSPCIPAYPPDLDCADVDGPISVTGSDPHGLDADGDGIACEF